VKLLYDLGWRRLLLLAFLAHLGIVVARIPHAVIAKRIQEVNGFRSRGAVRHHLDNRWRSGARAIEWIHHHVALDEVVLYSGERKGAMEFVPPLIFPRLLVEARLVPMDATSHAGRPIALLHHGTGYRQAVLVGTVSNVELVSR
jgi:hypothetical protein